MSDGAIARGGGDCDSVGAKINVVEIKLEVVPAESEEIRRERSSQAVFSERKPQIGILEFHASRDAAREAVVASGESNNSV